MAQNNIFNPYGGFGNQQFADRSFPVQDNMYYNQQNFQNQGFNQQNNQNNIPRFFQGRPVESVEVLRTMEIPYDGNRYYFPKADGTEVYGKRWLPNGSTETTIYVKKDDNGESEENKMLTAISSIDERLNNLQDQISMILQQNNYYQPQMQTYQQKRPNPTNNIKKPNRNYQQDGGDEQ